MSKPVPEYSRPHIHPVTKRLLEPRRFIRVISGPRHSGKTTLIRQVGKTLGIPFRYASVDEPGLRGAGWIAQQWESVRIVAAESDTRGAVLALDEIQTIDGWSETVERLWDEDSMTGWPSRLSS